MKCNPLTIKKEKQSNFFAFCWSWLSSLIMFWLSGQIIIKTIFPPIFFKGFPFLTGLLQLLSQPEISRFLCCHSNMVRVVLYTFYDHFRYIASFFLNLESKVSASILKLYHTWNKYGKVELTAIESFFSKKSVGLRASQCLFMWRDRWSDREKARSQWGHLNGLSPVCLR